jgi:spore coat protein CotH
MISRPWRWTAAVVMVLGMNAGSAGAQTADDLFNDQVLQRIDLYVNTRDWYVLRAQFDTNEYYPANLKWNGTTVTNVAIRSRGTGSRSSVKPALRVDFNRYATGRTFLGLTALDLNNCVQDASNLRELLAMKAYRTMGLQAPRIAPAALYVNNAYFGLYLVVEEIDETAMARMFGESAGYLFEYKWTFAWQFEYLSNDLTAYAALYEPKTHDTESAGALYLPVEAMIRTIADAPDERFVEAVSEYLDLAQFMRLTAVQAFIGEADGLLGNWGVNNHYLYRLSQKTLHRFVVWDASSSFHAIDYPLDAGHAESALMRRAMSAPALAATYRDTLLEAAALADQADPGATPEQPVPGWLEREAVRLLDLVRPAAYADRVKPFTDAEFDQAAAEILAFARTRGALTRRLAGRFGSSAAARR